MIERYTLTATREQLQQRFGVDVPEFYKPQYNAAPTHLLPVILQG
ncbi:MAG: SOS response-associated peptidase, partial [Cytophagia bacterium]|nr:SOS response-associated peptidase [Cytophagia bacterium]